MASGALLGYGSVFQTGDGNSPESFTSFEEVAAITLPKPAVDVIDTSHEQPPDSVREPISGFTDYGDVQIQFNFIPGNASATALMAELASKPVRNRKVIFPNGVVYAFRAFITGFESGQTVADKLTGSASFKVVGSATLS